MINLGQLALAPRLQREDIHKRSHPKMAIKQEFVDCRTTRKALNHTRHEISNDNEVADADTKAFDRDRGIENHGSIGIRDLRKGEE